MLTGGKKRRKARSEGDESTHDPMRRKGGKKRKGRITFCGS